MEIYMPDNETKKEDLVKTTHLAISAHHDDIEMMAMHGIINCFNSNKNFFSGIVVTDGKGSTRTGDYSKCSTEDVLRIRKKEQKKAAVVGEYLSQIFLDYTSAEVKFAKKKNIEEDIMELIYLMRPQFIYTHNPTDKHDTHVAVSLRVINALRRMKDLPLNIKVYGCEMWGSLDWMQSEDRIEFDLSKKMNITNALVGIYDSQIDSAKRYDVAIQARRIANATFGMSQGIDQAEALSYAMDLTPLINNEQDVDEFISEYTYKFVHRIKANIMRLS